jgi:hypothetical protein
MEDYDLWLRITAAGGVIYNLWSVLVKHRIHSGSAFNSAGHKPELLRADFETAALLAATWNI